MKKITLMRKLLLALGFLVAISQNVISQSLPTPTNLAVTDYGYTLTWTTVTGASDYNIIVKNTSGTHTRTYQQIQLSAPYLDFCVEDAEGDPMWSKTDTYIFTVQAINKNTGASSNYSSGYTFNLSVPPTPTNVTISSPTSPGSKITWSDPNATSNTN